MWEWRDLGGWEGHGNFASTLCWKKQMEQGEPDSLLLGLWACSFPPRLRSSSCRLVIPAWGSSKDRKRLPSHMNNKPLPGYTDLSHAFLIICKTQRMLTTSSSKSGNAHLYQQTSWQQYKPETCFPESNWRHIPEIFFFKYYTFLLLCNPTLSSLFWGDNHR